MGGIPGACRRLPHSCKALPPVLLASVRRVAPLRLFQCIPRQWHRRHCPALGAREGWSDGTRHRCRRSFASFLPVRLCGRGLDANGTSSSGIARCLKIVWLSFVVSFALKLPVRVRMRLTFPFALPLPSTGGECVLDHLGRLRLYSSRNALRKRSRKLLPGDLNCVRTCCARQSPHSEPHGRGTAHAGSSIISQEPTMKQRATVVCMRKGRLLLVAKERGRWAMPGGRPETDEPLSRTAFRELREETGLPAVSVRYAFQFRGASTRHFVFVADLPDGAEPSPGNEIARCRWARLKDVRRMPASIPTKGIADLLLRARPMVERTAGSAVHAGSSMAPRMARAMRGCAPRAPFAVSTVPLIASGESQSNHLVSPGRKVSGLRPGDGQSFPSVCSALCQTHAASPTTDRPLQPAYEDASKPADGRRPVTSRGDR